MKPKALPNVSVIIPTYNRAHLIMQSIESVLAQTYPQYEIIIIDDGSTDNTQEVLKGLIDGEKVRYIWQENKGESAARNHGIRQAQGQYIAFLDSDDLWVSEKLEKQVDCLEKHPDAGLVQSSFLKFDDLTGNNLGVRNTSWYSGWIYPEILMHWSDLIALDAVLIPRKVLDHVGGFDERFRRGEDIELWWRISRYYPFVAMPEVLTKVRVHSTNISSNRSTASDAFRLCLEKTFVSDPSLSTLFRRKALARMYSYMAYNQLGNISGRQITSLWRDCWNAIINFPFEWNAYLCVFLSFFPPALRQLMHGVWKKIRYGRATPL